MISQLERLSQALVFAADAHRNQRRKGAAQEPYINHLVEVLHLVVQATDGDDLDTAIAALLHDVLEDTNFTYDEIVARFGSNVADIVQANSDDMSLPKPERRERRIAAMSEKSAAARIVKFADIISNLRAVAISPPAGWSAERKLGYLDGCRRLVDAGRGANRKIECLFDETVAEVEKAVLNGQPASIDGREVNVRRLKNEIGQAVHLIYLANTSCRQLTDADVDALCHLIAANFPSATVQAADGIYEGRRRPVLLARIRTDSTDAVVELAQKICLAFEEKFVGIEVGGQYIRVYSDDTG